VCGAGSAASITPAQSGTWSSEPQVLEQGPEIKLSGPFYFLSGLPNSSDSLATLAAIQYLGQGQVAPELLQVVGHNCPSQGLRSLWRVEPDLERDRDSGQHTTQHNDLGRRHCFVKSRLPDFLEAYQDNQRILVLVLAQFLGGYYGGGKPPRALR